MVEDPRINFAISKRGIKSGVDHLGVQVESETELNALREQVAAAGIAALDQPNAECCYARSDKSLRNPAPAARKGDCHGSRSV
jgi:hypothetical protein